MKTRVVLLFALLALPIEANAQPDRSEKKPKKAASDLITKDTQKAIDAGLKYLAKEQAEDGSFGNAKYKGNVGITGLAGLAFLSAEPSEENDKRIAKVAKYLLTCEDPNVPGYIIHPKSAPPGPMYGHAFAVQFLADAYGRLGDKNQQKEVKALLERAVKLLVNSQNKEGGWRYEPRQEDADISMTACQVAALHAARKAGFKVPKATFDKALVYMKKCRDEDNGGFRYQTVGGRAAFARTVAALAAFNALGQQNDPVAKNALAYVNKAELKRFLTPDFAYFSYAHYFSTKAMWYLGDKPFRAWYPTIRDELVKNQKDDHWERSMFGSHYETASALIILQMPEGRLESLKRK
jgi:prenyltransferase beta subunit